MAQLDEEDQVKLDTWFQVMLLLEHYRAVTFEPMYARGRRLLASTDDRQNLAGKLEIIRKRHLQLQQRFKHLRQLPEMITHHGCCQNSLEHCTLPKPLEV